jgi:type IV pilus assembly protein PilQ
MTSLVAQAQSADATNAIERVDATQTTTGVVVSIELRNEAKAVPASFSVANPARVALDLPQTVNGIGRNLVELNQGDVRSVNLVQAGGPLPGRAQPEAAADAFGDARRQANPDRAGRRGEFQQHVRRSGIDDGRCSGRAGRSAGQCEQLAGGHRRPAHGSRAARHRLSPWRRQRRPDRRRLADPNTNVDIRQQGNTVVVDFLNTTLPDTLRRRLDVSDFATPVAQVTASQQGNTARLVVEPRGLWEHNAYQSDTRFVLEVRPVREDPQRLFQGTRQGYQGERLSLNFQNVDVRSLLQVIADFTNLNIITSDSVGGTITLRLKDVPWDQALDIILQSKGLDMRKNGNVILVAPRDEIAAKENSTSKPAIRSPNSSRCARKPLSSTIRRPKTCAGC